MFAKFVVLPFGPLMIKMVVGGFHNVFKIVTYILVYHKKSALELFQYIMLYMLQIVFLLCPTCPQIFVKWREYRDDLIEWARLRFTNNGDCMI